MSGGAEGGGGLRWGQKREFEKFLGGRTIGSEKTR